MINDRRQFKRFETLLIVDIQPHSEPSSFFFGITKNISFEGFIFESQNFNLKPGDILEFKLKHPKKDLYIIAVGEIIWVEKTKYEYLAGVKHRKMNEDIKSKILKLVSTDEEIVTELDINKEDPEIIVSETIDNSVLTEQPDAQDQSLISGAISRSISDIESDKSRSISSSSLKDSTDTSESRGTKKDETDRTESLMSFWDDDIKIPKQNRKSTVHKAAVLIATITVVASLSFVFWKSRVNVDPSALNASNDTATEDIEDGPEINMQALQDASDFGLPVISQESSPLSEPEKIAETEPPPAEQDPSLNVENTLIALKDSTMKSLTTNISSNINKQESKHRDTNIATITEDDNELIPVLLQPIKKMDKAQIAKAESIISKPEGPKSVELTESSQQSETKKATVIVLKENEAELSKKSNDVIVSDQKDKTVHSEVATDNMPIYPNTAKVAQKTEKSDKTVGKINLQSKKNKQAENFNRPRIIKYSAEPKKYFIQVGAWKHPALAKIALSELKKDYSEAYIFSKNNFQIIIIPDILTKSRANTMSKEIEDKFDLKPLVAIMHKEEEINSKLASTEIPKTDIIDRDSTSTDSKANAKQPVAEIVTEPITEAKLENTNKTKIALAIKKPDMVSNITPSSNKTKIALAIKKSDIVSNITPSSSEKGFIKYEDLFNDNSNNWDIFNFEEASARIENGFYHIENKKDTDKLIILHPYEFPYNSDFKIEASIKSTSIADNNFYGFVFGARDALDNYSFQINNNGRYSVTKNHGGSSQELTGGQINSLPSDNNSLVSLKIAKLDNTMFFYINDNYVNKVSNLTFFGNQIGFVLEGSSVIAIDRTRSHIKQKNQTP